MFNTLLELYQHSIHAYSSNKCFSMYGGEALTYRDFADRVDSLIETFVASGLSHGDKIALLSNNMPNWGAAYFAAAISGMVIVPILPDFSASSCTPRRKPWSLPTNSIRKYPRKLSHSYRS